MSRIACPRRTRTAPWILAGLLALHASSEAANNAPRLED